MFILYWNFEYEQDIFYVFLNKKEKSIENFKRILIIFILLFLSISSVSAEKDNSGNFTDSNTLLDESDISAQEGYSGTFTDLKI